MTPLHYTALCLLFSACGAVEALLWSRKGHEAFTWNEHMILSVQRVLIAIVAVMHIHWTVVVTAFIAFPFFQAGTYYFVRNKIDKNVYPKGFFAEPGEDSTAELNFKTRVRTLMFLGSLIIIALITYFS